MIKIAKENLVYQKMVNETQGVLAVRKGVDLVITIEEGGVVIDTLRLPHDAPREVVYPFLMGHNPERVECEYGHYDSWEDYSHDIGA
jgi:hypothetical protein